MTTTPGERYYFLGSQPRKWPRSCVQIETLRTRSQMRRAIAEAPKQNAVWIATKPDSTDELLREAIASQTIGRRRLGGLLMLFPPRLGSLPALEEVFQPIAWGPADFALLPFHELVAATTAGNRAKLFVAGFVDWETDVATLYRGNLDRLVFSLSVIGRRFQARATPLSIIDSGQTVCFGDYQAASDAILLEVDTPQWAQRRIP
ncbi:MAG: hypothetical protein L0387_03020 [Acidobacteria bacterium]|nr:hypothetical protein [Acidobacteriota bacterium]MCI0724772.1 hypothetical protein [Acidobacteriota bacterium]